MAQEIEIEYKNLLTKEEFTRLLNGLPFPKQAEHQINYYFETADFSLKKMNGALRIREKNNDYTLTLKEPHTTGLLETHDSLTKQSADAWLDDNFTETANVTPRLADKGIALHDLQNLGSLETERRELAYEGVLLVLDVSTYGNVTDYELELEAPSEELGKQKMHEVMERFGVPHRPTPNKIQRFFDETARHTRPGKKSQ